MHPNKKRYAAIFLSQFIWNINGERNFLLGKQVVINTWPFTNATNTAYKVLEENLHPQTAVLDAITKGCNRCEIDQCDFTVGYGGSPDTAGETTLDAMIIDGKTLNMGVVARLRKIKPAIEVARAVMEHSSHTILAGDGALQFAKMMGFKEESLETPDSKRMYQQWKDNHCQPNYFINVVNQSTSCPPYQPISDPTFGADNTLESRDRLDAEARISSRNHDTIGMLVLGNHGRMAAGTSSNGANHKIAGRVGDAAVPGAGAYVDDTVGGAAATGDGDVMMRLLPTFHAVQDMKAGVHPQKACERALLRIATYYPHFKGGMVCLKNSGEYGGAGYGWRFSYSVRTNRMMNTKVITPHPLDLVPESAEISIKQE